MADSNPMDRGNPDPDCPADEDAKTEGAVLGFILVQHPAHLTIPELSLALNRDPGDFSANDAVERAVRELVGAGLLHIGGGFVLPTRAARYFAALEVG
jgi:hypothetical protein